MRLLGGADRRGVRVARRHAPAARSATAAPLVASFASFEDYLHAPRARLGALRLREGARRSPAPKRYAEVEAAAVRPFVYRRYLDFGVFESLRDMKALIEREVERRELADHVKLGPGRHPRDRVHRAGVPAHPRRPRPAPADPVAAASAAAAGRDAACCRRRRSRELRAAYVFLRRLENRLQMLADAQMHQLPDGRRCARAHRARHGCGRLAGAARRSWIGIARASAATSSLVVFGGGERGPQPRSRSTSGASGTRRPRRRRSTESLARRRASPTAAEAARLLLELRGSALVRKLDEPGRKRLQALLPVLLADVAAQRRAAAGAAPDARDHRGDRAALGLLRAAAGERRGARRAWWSCAATVISSPQQIAAHPLLLDELIDERLLSELPERAELARELDAAHGARCRRTIRSAGRGAAPLPARGACFAWPSPI